MHQPLSHLYFNTVLEHLLCGEFTLSELCEIIDKLGQVCMYFVPLNCLVGHREIKDTAVELGYNSVPTVNHLTNDLSIEKSRDVLPIHFMLPE